ncbi:MAG: hypothetical protein M1837_000464 [Sclerophora amabilis]|nr:MAG: hypothetical protein M1837_000464 [Sclerophora amabilis]
MSWVPPEQVFVTSDGFPPTNTPPPYSQFAGHDVLAPWSDYGFVPQSHEQPPQLVQVNAEPADLRPGMGYIFPSKHTTLYVIEGGFKPYENPGAEFDFIIYRAPCGLKVRELLERLGATEGDDTENGVTECLEIGDGLWDKGISSFKSEDSSQQTLEHFGWNEERGKGGNPPVWLTVSRGQAT